MSHPTSHIPQSAPNYQATNQTRHHTYDVRYPPPCPNRPNYTPDGQVPSAPPVQTDPSTVPPLTNFHWPAMARQSNHPTLPGLPLINSFASNISTPQSIMPPPAQSNQYILAPPHQDNDNILNQILNLIKVNNDKVDFLLADFHTRTSLPN